MLYKYVNFKVLLCYRNMTLKMTGTSYYEKDNETNFFPHKTNICCVSLLLLIAVNKLL